MTKGLYYMAMPYHGRHELKQQRRELSLHLTAEFLKKGVHVFAPIVYMNEIAERLGFNTVDERRGTVMPYLFDFLKDSEGLILVEIDGWKKSLGVRQEVEFCKQHGIPVYQMKDTSDIDLDHILDLKISPDLLLQSLEAA